MYPVESYRPQKSLLAWKNSRYFESIGNHQGRISWMDGLYHRRRGDQQAQTLRMMSDWNLVQENHRHGDQEKARARKWRMTTTKGTVRMARTSTGPQTTMRTCGGCPLDRIRERLETEGIVPHHTTHGYPCIVYVPQPYRRVCHLCASLHPR